MTMKRSSVLLAISYHIGGELSTGGGCDWLFQTEKPRAPDYLQVRGVEVRQVVPLVLLR